MANSIIWQPKWHLLSFGLDQKTETTREEGDTTNNAVVQTDEPVTFHVGDVVRVHYRLVEKEKETGKAKKQVIEKARERIQVFEGIVMGIRGRGENASFTIRRIGADAVGIERVFPIVSPWIKKIEIKRLGDVRRGKLNYLRGRKGKAATYVKQLVTKDSKKKSSKK